MAGVRGWAAAAASGHHGMQSAWRFHARISGGRHQGSMVAKEVSSCRTAGWKKRIKYVEGNEEKAA